MIKFRNFHGVYWTKISFLDTGKVIFYDYSLLAVSVVNTVFFYLRESPYGRVCKRFFYEYEYYQ